MLAERLAKDWESQAGRTDDVMRFTDAGLVLGAGTVLAPAGASPRDVSVDPRDPRLAVLLAAAHLGAPTPTQLAHLAKAADSRRAREDVLAAMHLALSGLSRLARPGADAHRLFLTDGLLRAGVDPGVVLAAILPVAKYDPDQPRVPAGSGRASGQWTAGRGADAEESKPNRGPSRARGGRPARAASPSREMSSPSPRASIAQQSPPPPSGEVNPATVAPAADARFVPGSPYRGDDACLVALRQCIAHAVEDDPWRNGAANDNSRLTAMRIQDCIRTEDRCVDTSLTVQHSRRRMLGVAHFTDGGLVIMETGEEDLYFPARPRGKYPPMRRRS